MTIAEALAKARDSLLLAKVNSVRIDSELLLAHVLNADRAYLLAHQNDTLNPEQQKQYFDLIKRRAGHAPVVHLTNTREFYGLELFINKDVLTPRIETEKMVELALRYAPPNSKVIDVGTGSGAIAAALCANRPDLSVTATEIDPKACKVALRNFTNLGTNINLVQSDLFDNVTGSFDVIVCNLPYLADNADLMPEVQREPEVALFGGPDGLDIYRRFLHQLPEHLKTKGFLFTECDPWQQASLIKEAESRGLRVIEEDYFILGFQARD